MQFKKHNPKTPPERKPKWLRKGIAVLAAIATLATGGIVASTAYAEDPGDTGGGNQDAAGGWAGLRRGGRPGVCDRGEGVGRRNAASRLCLSPVEPGLVRGQDGFVVFFRPLGQKDRRLSRCESCLVQGQQYPGSFASEVFPADKQDRRVRFGIVGSDM